MSEGTAAPAAPEKSRPVKRPETRVRDALRIAQANPTIREQLARMLGDSDRVRSAARSLDATEDRCKLDVSRARAALSFAREIDGLDALQIAQIKGGLEALMANAKS